MAVNKVQLSDGTVLMDSTGTTVTAGDLLTGVTALSASGDVLTGTLGDFTGATSSAAGTHGLVPAPSAGDEDKVLTGAGTWQTVPGTEGVAVSATIQSTDWAATTWSAGAVSAGETSGGTCYAATITGLTGATASGRFLPSLATGNRTPVYATPGTDTMLLETLLQPSGDVKIEGVIL